VSDTFPRFQNVPNFQILDEIQYLYKNVDNEVGTGSEIDFHRHTDIATGSVINSVVNGYRFTANVSILRGILMFGPRNLCFPLVF
jgi:hypothetical protein